MISSTQQPIDLHAYRRERSGAQGVGATEFPEALRRLPRGVSVMTFGEGDERFGLTATSVSSLSLDPPTILVSVNRSSPISREFLRSRSFGVSVLAAGHDALAERFSGGAEIPEAERRDDIWAASVSGVPLLAEAVAAFDCEQDDIMECHGCAVVVGRVHSVRAPGGSSALVYWRGAYNQLGWTEDEISRAVGLSPVGAR
jgi:flavin reductase (DIM6/NTAB) family NADH-FMN oxidoreductase RutF